MSQKSKREYVERVRHRYLQGSRSEKTTILDEFVAVTGLHRKSAIRALRQGYRRGAERRGRRRKYTGAVVAALVEIWRVCGCICGKRLQPFLPQMVAVLERHRELVLDEETRALLLQMSAATIDRKLRPFRQQQGRGRSTTKPGTLLKQSIPVRTFAEWDEVQPGFVEMDLVAHCGETTEGQYLNTLTATDIATGWTECFLLRHRSQLAVAAAMDTLRQRLPFPLLGYLPFSCEFVQLYDGKGSSPDPLCGLAVGGKVVFCNLTDVLDCSMFRSSYYAFGKNQAC